MSYAKIGREVGCHPQYVRAIVGDKLSHNSAQSRFRAKPVFGRRTMALPPIDHPALLSGHTIMPSTVADPEHDQVLKSGHNSSKIGRLITKGKWKGFEVYTLTLEERATCPTSCKHWRSCFGNNMHHAQRFQHGLKLEQQIEREVAQLAKRHPRGFAIRLHVLGDFYSVQYVEMWARLIERHPQLHAFGFSARWEYRGDPIARALIDLTSKHWARFAIRFSNAPVEELATVSIEHPYQCPSDAIICPQQIGKTASCSTCALCWHTKKRIAFIQH